jgi:hypothetical protein
MRSDHPERASLAMRRAPALVAALLGVASCAGRTTPAPPSAASTPAPVAPVATATAEPPGALAYADGSRVCLAPVSRQALGAASCVATPSPIASLVWRSRTELAVLLDDRRVGILSGGAFSELPLPAETVWKVPKPERPGVPLQEGTRAKLVVSEGGELWLGRCAWVATVDVPACQTWVFARLGGAPKVQRDEPKAAAGGYAPGSAPGDVRLTVDGTRIRCERGAETSTFVAPAAEGASASVDISWPSASAPWYLVTVAYDYTEVVRQKAFLLKACAAGSGEALTAWAGDEEALVWGPGGTFAYRGNGAWVVRSPDGGTGRLTESAATPAFRP